MGSKVRLSQFNGNGDYSIWKQKMGAILVHHRVAKALHDPKTFSAELKGKPAKIEEMNEITYSSIILHLSDNVIYLLEKLFSFKKDPEKDLEVNLSDFSIIVKSLAQNNKKFEDEDLAVIILNSLLESYKDVKNVIKYARDTLTQVIVIDALRSRELDVSRENRTNSREGSLFVRE
ncbi:uncharacterized protein LOC111397640 [Olea europaea var. sylvestris]|uniref:uncharacterized protein LOC111397640 n=1 Tax=Olea europaea var. sylvestris TaxID=158386 RepID=UPI000C1D31C2|nr:uncharacterized protein LOC111397640 [Olea europaea var. sylvestris]